MGVVFVELTSYSQDLIAKLITQRALQRTPTPSGVSSKGRR
jgi:hypothetical protein